MQLAEKEKKFSSDIYLIIIEVREEITVYIEKMCRLENKVRIVLLWRKLSSNFF